MEFHRKGNFGEELSGMTEFIKVISDLNQSYIDELYDGSTQVLIVKNASKEDIHQFGELEMQDLYLKTEVPIGHNIDNDHVMQEYDMRWHSDRAYDQVPHTFVGLYCEHANKGSSPTYFHDNISGWKSIPDDLKQKIKDEGPVFHSIKTYFERAEYPHDFRSKAYERHFKMHAKGWHELYKNDKFGEYLFFSEGYANTKYLDEIKNNFYLEDNIHIHNWQPGDLVCWNNYTVSHKRDHTPPEVKRTLYRYAFHAI